METSTQALQGLLSTVTDEIYCQVPCKVTGVHGNFVDAIAYINDDEEDFILYNIPIKREETQSAYIFLGIHIGDYGTLRFYDRSIDDYIQGNTDFNGDERQHDINDRCFELGFIPNPNAFIYPTDQEIEIGLKNNKAKISIYADGNMNVISQGNITQSITGNVTQTISGNLTQNTKGNVTQNVSGNVNLTTPLSTITGDLTVNGTITATVDVIGNGTSLHTHTHNYEHGGLATGTDETTSPN